MSVNNTKNFYYSIGIQNLIFLDCIEPMDLPPSKKFRSMEKLVEFLCLQARDHGYGIRKGISHAFKNIYFSFDCGSLCGGRLKNLAKCDTSTHKSWRVQPPGIPLSFISPFLPTTDPLTNSDSGTLDINRNIKKAINKMWQEEFLGKTPIEVLGFLKESNWYWDVAFNASGEIQQLFFDQLGSIHLSQIKSYVNRF
ncbi:uncharacterized protein VP01_1911g2 [Puccinia sorghi]|uniref:Uncharacterized protein n=1 Tax=Puccinia sorghi TaxID=27349 RepID=A0A0L6VCU4_9BASI|nr:uncharacterized protein VP01_1911g2 [Puccinia sorghi]